jgi:hypothetical protein
MAHRSAGTRLLLEFVGWILLLAGLAALVLPGPGLLLILAGLALLSQQYAWAERRLAPVRLRALRGAAEGVETWPRILASSLGALVLLALGVVWTAQPDTPDWWPVDEKLWLFGGWGVGVSLTASALVAIALLVYSYQRFHGKPEAVAELSEDIAYADDARDGVIGN